MDNFLSNISLLWGKVIATIFFLGIILWAWFRPREYIFHDAPDNKSWRDLRIWATVILVVQVILYLIF